MANSPTKVLGLPALVLQDPGRSGSPYPPSCQRPPGPSGLVVRCTLGGQDTRLRLPGGCLSDCPGGRARVGTSCTSCTLRKDEPRERRPHASVGGKKLPQTLGGGFPRLGGPPLGGVLRPLREPSTFGALFRQGLSVGEPGPDMVGLPRDRPPSSDAHDRAAKPYGWAQSFGRTSRRPRSCRYPSHESPSSRIVARLPGVRRRDVV